MMSIATASLMGSERGMQNFMMFYLWNTGLMEFHSNNIGFQGVFPEGYEFSSSFTRETWRFMGLNVRYVEILGVFPVQYRFNGISLE